MMVGKEQQYGPCGLFCGACGAEDCAGCGEPPVDDTIRNCKFRICSMDKKIEFAVSVVNTRVKNFSNA